MDRASAQSTQGRPGSGAPPGPLPGGRTLRKGLAPCRGAGEGPDWKHHCWKFLVSTRQPEVYVLGPTIGEGADGGLCQLETYVLC